MKQTFKVQHNGIGKSHLLSEKLQLICNSKGDFCFSDFTELIYEGGVFYEKGEYFEEYRVCEEIINQKYCKKCIKSIKKQKNEQQTTTFRNK